MSEKDLDMNTDGRAEGADGSGTGAFRVVVNPERGREPRWSVSITTNGSQWRTLNPMFADEARAHRVADVLRLELAPEAAREERELEAML